ncbi:MAG: hypothetical protein ACM3VV_00790 [Deltaproteobacteria bacterium]
MMTLTYFSESIQIASATTEGNKQIVQQGIATSTPDPLPGHEAHQSVTILRLKGDNTVYEGTLSFIASKPVEVQILHRNMTSSSQLPKISTQFGTMNIIPLPGGNGQVVSSLVLPQYPEDATSFAASIPFAGNGLALHNVDGDQFVATYTVVADELGSAQRADDISVAAEVNADGDNGDGDNGDGDNGDGDEDN